MKLVTTSFLVFKLSDLQSYISLNNFVYCLYPLDILKGLKFSYNFFPLFPNEAGYYIKAVTQNDI